MKILYYFLFAAAIVPSGVFANTSSDIIVDYASNRVVRSGWVNVDPTHYLSGRVLTPEELNSRVVIVQRWCMNCPNIGPAVKEFQTLAKHYADSDFVFLSSYYPSAGHQRSIVEKIHKDYKITIPAYVGAASMGVSASREHRALYVVAGGMDEKWCVRCENTDIKALSKYLSDHADELAETSFKLLSESAPGRALLSAKRLKKLSPKKAAAYKDLIDPLNTAANRQMADFEEKVDALLAKVKPNTRDVKSLRDKVAKFASKAPDSLKDEIDALLARLN